MRKSVGFLVATALLILLGNSFTRAQTQFGSVRGTVKDPQGNSVPSAKVTLTNVATNVSQEAGTNNEGLYVVANVAAGSYEIKIAKEGFRTIAQKLSVAVAETVALNFSLELGKITETVTVSETALTINTTSGEIAREVTSQELDSLPLITRNPYGLVALAPGASDTGTVTGDTRGLGLAVAGARTSAINFMLDGGENNDTFVAGVGQVVPLDAVQEFKVQSNSTTAEYGRNAVVANVITKSGTNNIHGSAYEFYRGAALSTSPFDDKASGTPKSNFVRNQFGGAVGGPIKKDKTFFFGSFEGLRVRSKSTNRFFVPTQDFATNASTNTNDFLNAFGGIPASNCSDASVSAQDIFENIEGNGAGTYGTAATPGGNIRGLYTAGTSPNPTGTGLISSGTNLFCRTVLKAPTDSGAGAEQDTWLATGKVDHSFSQNTKVIARYAFQQNTFPDGSVSLSPFKGFDTGQRNRNQNAVATLTHSFSSNLFAELRGTFNRVFSLQPEGQAPPTTPCWFYRNAFSTATGDEIVFPGYVPNVCAFAGIPFGGPQNIYQGYGGFTLLKGKHTFKWGGQYLHLRDNRTFGAYENAFERTNTMQRMLNGKVDRVQVAIDPKGKVPGDVYNVAVDGPFQFPSFTRHFHYNEIAWYVEDSIKVTPRFTLTAGLRYEYFGVLHSPDKERFLDSNLFLDAVGSIVPLIGQKTIFEQIRDARFQRTNQFYRPDYNDFAPRLGIAWDIFGNGRTVFRSGYGIYYDRNFGNAVFNAIQNPPNYMVVTVSQTAFGDIKPNQFDTLSAFSGSRTLSSSARMLDRNLQTAYTAQWNATLEHKLFGKDILASASYLGANGYKLYSLNNLNMFGSCVLVPASQLPLGCDGGSLGRNSRLNQTGLTNMNRRGNEGLSRYNGLAFEVTAPHIEHTGLSLNGTYTWSHSIDNESSFFADSPFEGQFGFGFKDPFHPSLDRASSTNDIRNRGTVSGSWEIPWMKSQAGVAGRVVGGWTLSGIFVAQTGGAFSVYDQSDSTCTFSFTNFCYPVPSGSVPRATATPTGVPNTFALYDVSNTFTDQNTFCAGDFLCTAQLANLNASSLSARNLFRTPGFWNMDAAILKDFRMPKEGHKLQFRAEFYNLFNHANMFVRVATNQITGSGPGVVNQVLGARGLPPGGGKERRNIQLALRYIF